METFDLKEAKRRSGLSTHELTRLEKKVRTEFKNDQIMFELHFIRALKALREGWVTLEQVLSESVEV